MVYRLYALKRAARLLACIAGAFALSGASVGLAAELSLGGVELSGDFMQGGLVQGQGAAGTRITLDGQPVRVGDDGLFLLGFDRDAKPQSRIEVVAPDGGVTSKVLAIEVREYDIQRIDGLPKDKVTPPKMDYKRIRDEAAMVGKARKLDEPRADFHTGFIWPTQGRISGVYGSQRILNGKPKRPHYGVDVAAPVGTKVVAPADGIVTLVHPDMYFSGGTVILDHGYRLSSSFLHLSKVLVKTGQRVRQGDVIAEVGATGRVTGPHLDWRMNWAGAQVDPQLLVPPMVAQKSE